VRFGHFDSVAGKGDVSHDFVVGQFDGFGRVKKAQAGLFQHVGHVFVLVQKDTKITLKRCFYFAVVVDMAKVAVGHNFGVDAPQGKFPVKADGLNPCIFAQPVSVRYDKTFHAHDYNTFCAKMAIKWAIF
jgi:hypothetical protein